MSRKQQENENAYFKSLFFNTKSGLIQFYETSETVDSAEWTADKNRSAFHITKWQRTQHILGSDNDSTRV